MLHLAPAPVGDAELRWRSSVDALIAGEGERDAYYAFWPSLDSWPADSYADLISEIEALRRSKPNGTAGYLFSASGRLASSKLLFGLPKAPLRNLGIDVDTLAPGPTYFIITGPSDPESVVLVENPNAFERAVSAAGDLPVAWISAYGFGAMALDSGQRLAAGVADPSKVIAVVRGGSPPPLNALLAKDRLLYWGDLDRAGLQIYQAIRAKLPRLRLSALMQPMIDVILAGGGHPYVELTGKPRQKEWMCDDPEVAALLSICAYRAADQEYLADVQIRILAMDALPAPSLS
jgi:hypothetical protein